MKVAHVELDMVEQSIFIFMLHYALVFGLVLTDPWSSPLLSSGQTHLDMIVHLEEDWAGG